MSKKVLSITHASDLDGSMSGGVVGYWAELMGYEVDYKLYNYGYPINTNIFNRYDIIVLTDISFHEDHPEIFKYLGCSGKLCIWIDHHKSSIEFKNNHPEYFEGIKGVQKIGVAACELAWEYFFPDSRTPKLVEYLSAYDVFDKDRFQGEWTKVEQIQYGTRLEYGISPSDMCNYLRLLELGLTDYLEDFRKNGEIVLKYTEKNLAGKLKNYGSYIPEFTVEGLGTYRVIALNTNEFTSKAFESLYDTRFYDIMMPYCICPKEGNPGKFNVRFSMYTERDDIDVSKIAEIFSGGGHAKAAGGQMSLETLSTILSCAMSLKEFDNWLYINKKK